MWITQFNHERYKISSCVCLPSISLGEPVWVRQVYNPRFAYMDTRQLAAFCAVVERRSFSQAAERLGVTQPAVSLQVRALEKRLGTQLLDRSGRRVEPTEAGAKLYRSAQRLLALEEEIVNELAEEATGELAGTFEIGASTGPGGVLLSTLLCQFAARHPQLHVALSVFDTQ